MVASGERAVDPGLGPFIDAGRSERNRAADEVQTAHSSRRIGRCRVGKERGQRHQRQANLLTHSKMRFLYHTNTLQSQMGLPKSDQRFDALKTRKDVNRSRCGTPPYQLATGIQSTRDSLLTPAPAFA